MTRIRLQFMTGAAAIVIALAVAGCKTVEPSTKASTKTTQAPGGPEPSAPKTEFHSSVGPEQEYNVHVEMARVFESQGSNEAAVIEYQKAVDVCEKKGSMLSHSKLGPAQHSLAQRRMGAALDRIGRFAQAEPHYLKALTLTPNNVKVWNDAGYSYYLQHRLADAERTLKTANSLDANNPRVQTNLGLTLTALGKHDEALAVFSRAGGSAVGHANHGYILAAMGKTAEARAEYQTALAEQPTFVQAREALAKLDASSVMPAPPVELASATVKDSQVTRTTVPQPAAVPPASGGNAMLPLPVPNPVPLAPAPK